MNRRIAGEIGLAAGCAALLAGTAVAIADSWGAGYWAFDCAAGAVACGIALARRRHPVWAAVAGCAVALAAIAVARLYHLPHEPGPAMALALAVLVGAAVRTLPVPSAAGIAAAGLAVVVASRLVVTPGTTTVIPDLNATAWLVAVAIGLGLRLLAYRRCAATARVRRAERLELARELHDVVAHHITAIVLQAQAAQLVAGKDPAKLHGSLSGIEAAGTEALAAMRRVVGLLRDAGAVPPAAPESLDELVGSFAGPPVRLSVSDDERTWPPEVAGTVFRVVREALTNITRHAPHARAVTVTVAREPSALTVEVADDAPPANTRPRGGYGLIGMRERVESLGGTLSAGPHHDTGWSVRATLPLRADR